MSSSPSRAAQFAKVYKVLKKSYKPVAPAPDRQVLEHLVFAGCLENAHPDKAEEAYATLVHTFFDWNEIRVTTVKELAEVLAVLPDAAAAASRVKRILQHVFESTYSFDLEEMRKKNLGQSVERLRKFPGITGFVVSYAIQHALGGHAIPLDAGTLGALRVLEIIGDKDVAGGEVPGMERAIAKNKGIEFASLLHQLGADFIANPYSSAFHKILLQINPDISANLPKRRVKPKNEPETPAETKGAGRHGARPGKAEAAIGSQPESKAAPAEESGKRAKGQGAPREAEAAQAAAAAAASAAKKGKGRPASGAASGASEATAGSATGSKKGSEEAAAPAAPAKPAGGAKAAPVESKPAAEAKPAAAKKKPDVPPKGSSHARHAPAAAEPAKSAGAGSKKESSAKTEPAAVKKSVAAGLSKRKPR